MKEALTATLSINKAPTEMNPFVEQFLARVVVAAVSTLKGTEEMESLEVYIEKREVSIVVNGKELPLTPFPSDIIVNTLEGLVSTLKGVDRVESLDIVVKAG